jgi:hypothetical protein
MCNVVGREEIERLKRLLSEYLHKSRGKPAGIRNISNTGSQYLQYKTIMGAVRTNKSEVV